MIIPLNLPQVFVELSIVRKVQENRAEDAEEKLSLMNENNGHILDLIVVDYVWHSKDR